MENVILSLAFVTDIVACVSNPVTDAEKLATARPGREQAGVREVTHSLPSNATDMRAGS